MRRFRFFFVPPGPTKMCVYKGVTGLVVKLPMEAGKRWPAYFGIRPKPIWCGWTILEEEMHVHVGSPEDVNPEVRYGGGDGATPAIAAAAAWANLATQDWSHTDYWRAGAYITVYDWGGSFYAEIEEKRFSLDPHVESWWAAYPGVQPERMVITADVWNAEPGAGSLWLPDFYRVVPMDSSPKVIEIDVSGISFPPSGYSFPMRSYESDWGYYCTPPDWGNCDKGAMVGWNTGPLWIDIDWYAGGGGWEYIDIPDWIFESPGKYWLAMVDENGVMLPGPYLPLN